MDLSLLAPGARRNEAVGLVQNRQGYALTKVDGQDVTINYHSSTDSEQPGYSRDAIGEFEVIANRFDASQGRSAGMLVNAVTKSGTNVFAGTFAGYFRDDTFNAADFVSKRVLPYSNQQLSGTLGGPRSSRIAFTSSAVMNMSTSLRPIRITVRILLSMSTCTFRPGYTSSWDDWTMNFRPLPACRCALRNSTICSMPVGIQPPTIPLPAAPGSEWHPSILRH